MALRYGITIILLLVDKVCRPISSLADWQCRGGKDGETAAGLYLLPGYRNTRLTEQRSH